MSKKKSNIFSDSVNYAELRRLAGFTLDQVAKLSGYGVATINGLEKKNLGSKRLRETLLPIYQVKQAAEYLHLLQETPETALDVMHQNQLAALQYDLETERERAERCRKVLRVLRKQIDDILLFTDPPDSKPKS